MKKSIILIVLSIFLSILFFKKDLLGNGSGPYYVNVTYEIKPVTVFNVSGNPPTLIIDSMEAGSPWAEVSDNSTTYSFASNEWVGYKKITGRINQPMPEHTYLKVNLESWAGESQGDVILTTNEQNLVINIEDIDWDCMITYKFGASPQAGVLSGIRIITFTLSDM